MTRLDPATMALIQKAMSILKKADESFALAVGDDPDSEDIDSVQLGAGIARVESAREILEGLVDAHNSMYREEDS